jgi:hypothetical protein
LQIAALGNSVDALDRDEVTVNHVNHSEPTDTETVIIPSMEGVRRIRVCSQRSYRHTDLAHPVLVR